MLWAPCPGALTSLCLVLSQLKPLGCDGNSQPSVPAWLDSLGLQDYIQSFLSSGYSSIDTVKNLWELEIVNVSTAGVLAAFPPSRSSQGAVFNVSAPLGGGRFASCRGQESWGACGELQLLCSPKLLCISPALLTATRLSLQVLKVNLLGHRKRIIASLADRPYEEPPAKPPRFSQLRVSHRLCPHSRECLGALLCPGSPSLSSLFFQRTNPGSARNHHLLVSS